MTYSNEAANTLKEIDQQITSKRKVAQSEKNTINGLRRALTLSKEKYSTESKKRRTSIIDAPQHFLPTIVNGMLELKPDLERYESSHSSSSSSDSLRTDESSIETPSANMKCCGKEE